MNFFLRVVCLFLVSACAEQRIRDHSLSLAAEGKFEQAIEIQETALLDHPESVVLRSGLIEMRARVSAHLQESAAAERAAGRFDSAQKILERAKGLNPNSARVQALMSDLQIEQRQAAAVAEAQGLLSKKQPELALRVVLEGLKDNPLHAGLLALRHTIEQEQRLAGLRVTRNKLSEARRISLDFRDANLRAVLDVASRNSGINFILDRDIRPDTRVTIYVHDVNVEDALDLLIGTNQLAKKVIDDKTIAIYPNTQEKQREYQEQLVRVFYLASADAKGAAAFLKSMLKIHEPYVEERTNMLALRDSEDNVALAERLLSLYDANEPEVLMEVEVMEMNTTRLTELGIQFPKSFSLTPVASDGSSSLTLASIQKLTADRISIALGGATVNLRREVGDYTTLANPRIRARNKEKAKVMIGDKIPVITSTTSNTGFVSDSVNYVDVGVKLDVEPTVYANDDVAIRVGLEVSSLGDTVKTTSGTLAYQIGTRSASTLLRLHDGETQLLAGLISKDTRTSSVRVPGLGDIPLLGRLFSSQTDNNQRTELVLAITPRILRNIRRPDATEAELRVGTDALPRLHLPIYSAGEPAAVAASSGGGALAVPTPKDEAPKTQMIALRWDGPKDAKVGELVEFSLVVNSAIDLRGMPAELSFDPKHFELIAAVESDYFKRDGASTSFTQSVEAHGGRLRLGVLRNLASGSHGEGKVFTIRLKTLVSGTSEIQLVGAQPIGVSGPPPAPSLPAPLSVQVR